MLDERIQGLTMERGNPDCTVAPTEDLRLCGWKLVAFVEDQDPWELIEGETLKHGLDRCDMSIRILRPCIHDMEEKVGIPQFVQCRSERCHEILGQVANKPDRISEDNLTASGEMQSPACGIERFEDARSRTHLAVR